MPQLGYEYAIGIGHGLALNALANIEDLLYPFTKPRRLTVRTQMLNAFPVRTVLGSGRERGDGAINHAFEFTAINQDAVAAWYAYLWSGSVVSTAVTIYTRLFEAGSYGRYSAYAVRPLPGQDVEHIRGGIYRLTTRFNDLAAL